MPFVSWLHFLAGLADIVAGVGLWLQQRWARWLAVGIVLATALVFVALGIHAATGGTHEARTMVAMCLRTLVWAVIAAVVWRWVGRRGAGAR